MALGRLSVLKGAEFLSIAGTSFDNQLKNCLKSATAVIERGCKHDIQLKTNTDEFFIGKGAKYYYPRNWPVNSVTQIKFADSGQVIDPATYEIRGRAVWVLAANAWQVGLSGYAPEDPYRGGWSKGVGYKITYQSGFDNNNWNTLTEAASWPVPMNIEYATCELAAMMWKQGQEGGARLGISTINRGGEGAGYVRYNSGLPDSVQLVIREYSDYPV